MIQSADHVGYSAAIRIKAAGTERSDELADAYLFTRHCRYLYWVTAAVADGAGACGAAGAAAAAGPAGRAGT